MIKKLVEKTIFLLDFVKILFSEILGFLRSLRLKNHNIKKLFELEKKRIGKNLLIVSLTNLNYTINIESLFAKYFNLRGYKVFFLTNFRERKAVQTFKAIRGNIILHHCLCLKKALTFLFKKLPAVEHAQGLKEFSYRGIPIGIGVYSTLSRKLKVGRIDFSDKQMKRLAKRYLWRSMVYLEAAREILERVKPDLVLALEKGYIGHSEIFNLAVENDIDLIQWCGCHDPNSLMLKRYHKNNQRENQFSVSNKVWQHFLKKPWQENYRQEVYRILEKGYFKQTWFQFNKLAVDTKPIAKDELIKKYQLDPSEKIAVLFSHVLWDANLFHGEDLFKEGFEEWLVESAKAMVENKHVNWLLKIHPANRFKHQYENIKGEYREVKALKEVFGEIPQNIKMIYPEDNINPLSLFKIIDYGITVRGTIGMEAPCFGVAVLTAGTGRYSDRGFTVDSSSKEEYLGRLARLQEIPRISEEQERLAILHAYLVFKLRPLRFSSFKEKFSGKEMDLDIMIKRPEEGKDFLKLIHWAVETKEEDFLDI